MKLRLPRNAKHLALIALIAMSLSACERSLTDANLRVVKPEMTTKEVESILGPPNTIETRKATDPGAGQGTADTGVTYTYLQKDRKVTLTFSSDRLIPGGISGSFE